MYKATSKNSQFAASHIKLPNLMSGNQNLTIDEKFESFKESYRRLIEINKNETDKNIKRINGMKLQEMAKQMGFYKKEIMKNSPPMQITDYLIQIFKEKVSKEEWSSILEEARFRALK